jgi:hypothetical protein
MTAASLLAVLGFALLFGTVGYGVTAAFAPPSFAPSLALAYPVGLAVLGVALTLEVIVGVPFGITSILVTAAALAAAAFAVARRHGRPLAAAHPATWAIAIPAAVTLAALVVVVEAAFRAARLQGLFGWDAGSFWVPKAEVLYVVGDLDEALFTALPGPTYPPLVPVLQATALSISGSADPVVLHLVYWTILAGFAGGIATLVARYAGATLAVGTVLVVVTAGEVRGNAMTPQGDFLMDVFFAFAALLTLLWIRGGDTAYVRFALPFVAAAALTKREALLFAACLGAAALVATGRRWRTTWAWSLAIPATAVVAWLPWSVWFARRDIGGNAPEAGPIDLFDHLDRIGPALGLVARTAVDAEHWSVLFVVVVLCVVAGLASGERESAVFLGSFVLLCALGFVWIEWSVTSLPLTQTASLNPIVRTVGVALVPATCCAPVVASGAFERFRSWERGHARRLALVAVAVVALAYPAAVLAIDGAPRFPTRDDCADVLQRPREPFELVYVRTESLRRATTIHDRLVKAGFVDAELQADGCGRWKVVNPGVETLDQVPGHVADARRFGVDPQLEAPG